MPMSVPGFSWIREVLDLYNRRSDPKAVDLRQGFDVNGDGHITEKEKPRDLNNGVFDPEEWQDFLRRNPELQWPSSRVNVFKWAASLDPRNPLHDLLAREAEVVPEGAIEASYALVTAIVTRVREEAIRHQDWTPVQKLQAIRQAVKDAGIQFQEQVDPLFSTNIKKKKALDCDTLGDVVAAVGHEMKWPIFLVRLRDHAFVRWYENNGTISFNMDNESIYSDEFYRKEFLVDPSSEQKHVYMTNMDRQQMNAFWLNNRGIAKGMRGDYPHAIEDFTLAIKLNPNLADAFYNRAYAKAVLLNYRGAIEDFTATIQLDPNFAAAFYSRGIANIKLGDIKDAADDLRKAARDPEFKSRAEEVVKQIEKE